LENVIHWTEKVYGDHLGGFNGPDLEVIHIAFTYILLARTQSWLHITAREAGKCSLVVPSEEEGTGRGEEGHRLHYID
jgi:hypothetical protein